MNGLTQQAQEVLAAARHAAVRVGNSEVDGEHLLLGLLERADGRAARIVADLGGDPERLRVQIEEDLELRPRVSGADAEPDDLVFTRRLRSLLDAAAREADEFGDERVAEEHLLVALAEEGATTPGGLRLREQGITPDASRAALVRERRPAPSPVERSATTDAW